MTALLQQRWIQTVHAFFKRHANLNSADFAATAKWNYCANLYSAKPAHYSLSARWYLIGLVKKYLAEGRHQMMDAGCCYSNTSFYS